MLFCGQPPGICEIVTNPDGHPIFDAILRVRSIIRDPFVRPVAAGRSFFGVHRVTPPFIFSASRDSISAVDHRVVFGPIFFPGGITPFFAQRQIVIRVTPYRSAKSRSDSQAGRWKVVSCIAVNLHDLGLRLKISDATKPPLTNKAAI